MIKKLLHNFTSVNNVDAVRQLLEATLHHAAGDVVDDTCLGRSNAHAGHAGHDVAGQHDVECRGCCGAVEHLGPGFEWLHLGARRGHKLAQVAAQHVGGCGRGRVEGAAQQVALAAGDGLGLGGDAGLRSLEGDHALCRCHATGQGHQIGPAAVHLGSIVKDELAAGCILLDQLEHQHLL